mgnify:CR=1 FL=1
MAIRMRDMANDLSNVLATSVAEKEVLRRCVEIGQDCNLKRKRALYVHHNVLVEFASGNKGSLVGYRHVFFEMREPLTSYALWVASSFSKICRVIYIYTT